MLAGAFPFEASDVGQWANVLYNPRREPYLSWLPCTSILGACIRGVGPCYKSS